jgi:acetyltransferase-like isoleucine patch superfamily enzyme
MVFSNIQLGQHVEIDPSTSVNNVVLNDHVRIAKRCSIFGGENNLLEIGAHTYIGMNTIVNGFVKKVVIGEHVSIAQSVSIICDSGPNASPQLQRLFPLESGPIHIGDHCWIGAFSMIMPNVVLGKFCIVAANSFVKKSFPAYSIIGGTPARLIRMMTPEEIATLEDAS